MVTGRRLLEADDVDRLVEKIDASRQVRELHEELQALPEGDRAVLEAGCGTGENALHIASRGLPVLGVDVDETALAIAREKADDRGIKG